jgi:hypothetical protein
MIDRRRISAGVTCLASPFAGDAIEAASLRPIRLQAHRVHG